MAPGPIPYVESWNIGWQRALSRDMAFELRYVGNRNKLAWTTENWNTHNIFENGFLDEFKVAQADGRQRGVRRGESRE